MTNGELTERERLVLAWDKGPEEWEDEHGGQYGAELVDAERKQAELLRQGRYEGAEAYRIKITRENDDAVVIGANERIEVLRASIGGNDEHGYYLVFRGDPERVVKMLELMYQAAKQQLPRGIYRDNRT